MADASKTPQALFEHLLEFLRGLGVEKIHIAFEGSDDSGAFRVQEVLWRDTYHDGSPVFPFDFEVFPSPPFLPNSSLFGSIIDAFHTEIADGWENNEGGGGHIILSPFETELFDAVDVHTYHNESYREHEDHDADWEPEGVEALLEQNAMGADGDLMYTPNAVIRTEKKRPTFEEITLPVPVKGR